MLGLEAWFRDLTDSEVPVYRDSSSVFFVGGGLFLDSTVPASFVSLISTGSSSCSISGSLSSSYVRSRKPVVFRVYRRVRGESGVLGNGFLSVSLSIKESDGFVQESNGILHQNGEKCPEEAVAFEADKEQKVGLRGAGAMNTTKHLWAGAVSAMVSRLVFVFMVSVM